MEKKQKSHPGFQLRTLADLEPALQSRDGFTLVWVRQASGKYSIDFQDFALESGQFYSLAPGKVHLLLTDPDPDGYILNFSSEFLSFTGLQFLSPAISGLFPELGHTQLRADENFEQSAQPVIDAMSRLQEQSRVLEKEIAGGYLRALLLHANSLLLRQAPIRSNLKPRVLEIAHGFQHALNHHIRKAHEVGFYAEKLQISPGYLNSVIRTVTGKSPKTLIQERLLVEAKTEAFLRDSSLKDAARKLGFYDPAHFSNFFKKGAGITFMEFRHASRKGYGL